MISFTNLQSLYGSLSQNTSATNLALGAQLMNQEHRYLLQKYFANETTYSIPTAGGTTATLTGSLSAAAITATLNSAWTGNTTKIQVTFSSSDIRMVNFIQGSTALTWDVPLTTTATAAITLGGQQYYPLPPNYSKLKSVTIRIGNLQWTLGETFTTNEWNQKNVFPYYADIPSTFFIFPGGDHGGQIGIWPIPSTTNNIITFSYKFRVPDLSLVDYTTPGTVSVTTKTNAVTGSGTSFVPTTNIQNESRWIQFAQPNGDNQWYQISSIPSTISALLYQPYQGVTVTGTTAGTYTIGQMPIIAEDFHDMLYLKALMTYFSSIVDKPNKYKEFKDEYDRKLALLAEYSGSNTVQVNLRESFNGKNPNIYPQSIGGTP